MTTGVPRGSVLDPILYTVYVGAVSQLIANHGVQHHQYADAIQIFTRMTADAIESLQACVNSLQHWFWANGLLLNPNKSSVAYFGTGRRLQNTALPTTITVAGSNVDITGSLHILGVTLDSILSLDKHVNNMVKTCNFHLQALLAQSINRDVANAMACAIIGSRLDYCNSMFTVCHEKTLISFSASRTVQHGLFVALVESGRQLRHSLHCCQFEQEPTSSWRHSATSHGWWINLTIWLQNFLSTTALSTFVVTGTVNCTSL